MQHQIMSNTMKRGKVTVISVFLLEILHCFVQSDGNFMIYNSYKKRCLGDRLDLVVCDPESLKQQFRWTSESRIFNVAQKKCLGASSQSEGKKLQWSLCDTISDLQKWECHNNLLFGLKNESFYLAVQGDSLVLSTDPGEKGKWTIPGTMDSICSIPYKEIYTINGNAFGRPCHFPFHYKNKWYADCTTDGRSSSRPWCAVESKFYVNAVWGYCPTRQKDDEFWKKNPLTGIYYQMNEDSALSWYQSRESCQQQGGDLLSITEPHEQTFISGLTRKSGAVLWTGLNSLDTSSGWRWVNEQPLRYLKWLSGQPSPLPGHSCGVLSQVYNSEWSTAVCSKKHGYICQSGLPTPTVPPVVHTGSCTSPWIPYSGHCYFLSRTKRTWLDAKDACRREGGDLLSILSVEEQSFIISQLGYSRTDELWIGLNDLKTVMLFEWSDHSSVQFALWDVNEPSHNAALKEDCVLMRGEEGKWADQTCQNKYGYICKKKTHLNPSTDDTVVTNSGCKPGWVRHGYYCYLAGSEAKTFEEAKQMCERTGSYLADVTNRVENAFLVSLIGARPEKHFWIGLSNQKDRHTFEWTNTKTVLFTHFNAGMPGVKQGCIAMTTGVLAGLWDVLNCTNAEKYICKQKAEGVIITPPPPTPPPLNCSEGWDPLPNRDLCLKMFSQEYSQQKTWSEALKFCRELGGDLLSIHSPFDLHAAEYRYVSTSWIGYSIQDPSVGYTWSDGSSSSYENWKEGEPNNLNNMEKCVQWSYIWWDDDKGKWNDMQCEDKTDWFCEIRKGVTPKDVEISDRTYNTTDDGWVIFKDNQYFIRHSTSSMEEGRSFCKHRHGELLIINDEEERVFVWHLAKQSYTYSAYIGMNIDMDKSVRWVDGSPVVFQAWEQNQPAFLNSEEHCVKMTMSQGFWESENCGVLNTAICKRSGSVPVNATAAPTEPPRGGCAPDWVKFQNKCYKVQMKNKTWTEARSYCKALGGNLASVTDSIHQAFLISNMADEKSPDLWLGFSNLADRSFRWTDGSRVSFTNWARSGYYTSEPMCVAIGGWQTSQQGKWVEKDCNDTNGFICSRSLDHLVVPSPTEMPKTFIPFGNSSYMIVQTNLTWKEAQRRCEREGANLASIRDARTQSYIELQIHKLGRPLWIGLNSMETDGYFRWIDNWQLNRENWDFNQPKKGHPCVYMDTDGNWKTAQCNQTYYSVCKKSKDISPTPPAQFPGICPEITEDEPHVMWLPFRGHCYAFMTSSESWISAANVCRTRGANLVSIQDTKEAAFIENYINFIGNGETDFWIGLFKTYAGHWQWLDNSVVDYTNWKQDEDEDDEDDYFYSRRDCAFISSATKQWGTRHCQYGYAPYICKMAKVPQPTPGMNHTADVVDGSHHPYAAGVSVVVVIAVLCVLAGLAYIYNRTSNHRITLPSVVNPMYYSTGSPLSTEKDTKTLVDHMDINE